MVSIGTPFTPTATRLLLLGSGELGKEVAIEAQRLGVEVWPIHTVQFSNHTGYGAWKGNPLLLD